ncbi:MAG: hypothetical protein HDQ99_16520 [Lachnospiraceae bacterium]|nr:hypothetical protein [Lachnospiraceae bacterium]
MDKWKEFRFHRICCNYIFPLILLLYPLRHIHWGLDLWDTGYNYANFRYMGLEHMDSMWLFSTYLANVVGHFFTLLPGGHTLLFMNLYTGLFTSLLAVISYLFLTRRVKLPAGVAFVGEFAAVSLCFCPTALLYNYLTYVLFLAGVLFLYEGLSQEKNRYLVLAGVMLGTNVFVRFSNLPEAAMIVGVWAYAVICRKKWKKVLQETGFCMLGYVGAVLFWLGFLSLRYGLPNYVEGIKRLFAMTETATDYKASSMLYRMFSEYIENLYWVNRILFFAVPGVVVCMVLPKSFQWVKRIACAVFAAVAAVWLYTRKDAQGNNIFCDLRFDEYSSMQKPAILFLILTLIVCLVRVFGRKTEKKEKLLAGLIFLSVLLTSIGSNNGLFTSFNNLFLAAPYVLWNVYRLCRSRKEWKIPLVLPIKALAIMFTAIFLFQSIGFGTRFVFAEATGVKSTAAKVENNAVLKGIRMSEERARWLSEISAYISENELTGREVILYGYIPSLSFYLELPSAFNPWSDLTSYSAASMAAAMERMETELAEDKELPIVILNKDCAADTDTLSEFPVTSDPKLAMIVQFIKDYNYKITFFNEKFVLYEAVEE